MPFPPFDAILNVLPPHRGDPRDRGDLSPYDCSMVEICERLATSEGRKRILNGLLRFRRELLAINVRGFQWLGGSFVEDIETQEGRAPNDIDVVTFVSNPTDLISLEEVFQSRPELLSREHNRTKYNIDHFLVPLCSTPRHVVDHTRYWCGLFSHRRDHIWKGMLVVDLAPNADGAAKELLELADE
jgi:hypothetical protein